MCTYASRVGLSTLVILLIIGIVSGCGGKSGLASPQTYGNRTEEVSKGEDTASTEGTSEEQSEVIPAKTGSHGTATSEATAAVKTDETKPEGADLSAATVDNQSEGKSASKPQASWTYYSGKVDIDDSASAVDDEIWRQLDLAEEYHAMGVIANREGSWEEGQYYFEEALRILAALDIESDSLETPEAAKYTIALDDIIADYRVTLRSLGHLDRDVSSSAVMERFGDMAERIGADSMYVSGRQEKKITYDLPIVMNDRVKKSIIYYQTVARDAFTKFLVRSHRYKRMMLEIIDEYGLPHDLVYLSMVESGYNPRAYSWARASGLWQFISSTGREYKLNRSWWWDERRDPVKSTHAACQFLKDLYEQFGCWELAMAAYNGGPGRVRGTIKKQKTIDFWKMRLRRQTMDYVPLIMAATIIGKEPAKYGFENIEFEDEIVWDEVEIDKCLELSVVAKTVGCSTKELQDLNPELLRKYTPPDQKKYILKVPRGAKGKLLAAYESLPSPKETSWVRHEIRRGESISTIASRYGVSQYAIMEANNLSRRSTIYAGKKLIVPVPLDREARSSKKNRNYEAKGSIYAVRSGDTMWDIARAFGTTVNALRQINYIERGSRIYVGQKLKIPSEAKYLASRSTSSSGAISTSSGSSNKISASSKTSAGTHKVRRGDTLWDIARKYGLTTSQIRRLNGLGRSSRIYPGQELIVSGGSSSGSKYIVHKVRRGETLDRIARKYSTSIKRIVQANNLRNPNKLRVGDKLKIYRN
ncbi:MAG: LysM peptidoglycan-binding domain-containing protein [candidate division Zixibacteria bacterium]|nr:LysM peptidoglycan-binding domain-containing protein [candidate division Zixibacteria bacterium]